MHTHLLARKLRSRGHDVTLFATTRSKPSAGLEAICPATAIAAVGTAEANDVAFFREHHAYLSLMSRLRRSDFDIIHNNSLHYLPVTMADTLPMPMVTTLHTPPFCWLESGLTMLDSPNHALVAVSRSVSTQWRDVRAVDAVVMNGIDLKRFTFCAEPHPEPYLVWYGRIVPEKGLHLAMEAARRVGLPLKIAGPVHDRRYYRERIEPALGSAAIHVGHLDHQKLAELVSGARAFLCAPLWDEPYGLVVAEALACGVPVAAFARGAIPEILDGSSGILARPDDAASLADAIPAAMRLERRACRHRAETVCDVRHMIDGYEALYAQLVGNRSAGDAEWTADRRVADRRAASRGNLHG